MASKQKWFRHIDWMINWLGFSFLAACILLIYLDTPLPTFKPWDGNPFSSWNSSGAFGIPVMYVAMLAGCTAAMILSQLPEKKKAYEWKKFMVGYTCVWVMTMLSKWIAAQTSVKSASIGDSIWAIFFGCTFYHVVKRVNKKLLHCLELSKQTELYIATSLVLLVINFSKLKLIIGNSLFVAWIDTVILFVVFSYIGVKIFKLRAKQSMILTGCTVICGSSAATAIRNSLKGKEKDQKDAILISSLLTIPCIIILPIIGKAIGISDDIAGSWFGGSVDSTGAVFATGTQFSNKAATTAAVVKMIQNVLIAPISVAVVAFYVQHQDQIDADEAAAEKTRKKSRTNSKQQLSALIDPLLANNSKGEQRRQSRQNSRTQSKEGGVGERKRGESINADRPKEGGIRVSSNALRDEEKSVSVTAPVAKKPALQISYLALIWERFPKFVLGFVVAIIIFNVAIVKEHLDYGRDFIFCISEWFSTCSFVSIGMSLQLAKGDGKQLMILSGIYLIIQVVDILTTLGYAYIAYTYF